MIDLTPIDLKGEFYTVRQFAFLTNRSPQTIYNLIKTGNSVRKLVSRKIELFSLIPISELTHFPFTNTGRNAQVSVYHYTEDGQRIDTNELEEMI